MRLDAKQCGMGPTVMTQRMTQNAGPMTQARSLVSSRGLGFRRTMTLMTQMTQMPEHSRRLS
jgi:hypothetical protein